MSLKEADWKAELNKPKNLGLKVIKTGVSEALRNVEVWHENFQKDQTNVEKAEILSKKLMELRVKCLETINKHKKLYTTACEYLAKVAEQAHHEFQKLEPRIVAAKMKKLKELPSEKDYPVH
jgi:hypothetical protein